MPYSDPEKKREYMKKYNPKYYSENREPLIKKNINRKKTLRDKKREHILMRLIIVVPIVETWRFTPSNYTSNIAWKNHRLNPCSIYHGLKLNCYSIITILM